MHFVVHALDRPDALARRLGVIDAHRAYLAASGSRHRARILMSGPLMDDAAQTMTGSFFLIEASGRHEVEALFADDPLAQADVWASCTITAFHLRTNAWEET